MKQKITTAAAAISALKALASAQRAECSAWFFKNGPEQYGEGDKFFGVTVPQTRSVLRDCDLPISEQLELLKSPYHESRLLAVLHLSRSFRKADQAQQKIIYDAYLANTAYVNNWDLVDSSASDIVGVYLFDRSRTPLLRLAKSKLLWERRIAVIACFHFIKQGDTADILKLATLLLNDKEDLIHKAVGWMLREMGGRGNMPSLLGFLDEYANRMPRTMLRYAIEKLPETKRQHYLKLPRFAKDK
jgi:3-methyladenine DNA glycosylase AlkD